MLERVAAFSIAVNVFLTLLNLVLVLASDSLAVAAEMIHNVVDLAASVAVLVGLRLSTRRSRGFPYGLYKVENLVSVGIAILIFIAGWEIARHALLGTAVPVRVEPWILGGVLLSMAVPLLFSAYEMRVGKRFNSPSVQADAEEYRVHFYSSGIVFLALVGQLLGLPLDRGAAVVVVAIVARTGWKLLKDGMRVLLDAALDADTLARAKAVVSAHPGVLEVKSITGRSAGRYRFMEVEVRVRLRDLERAHLLSHAVEEELRREVPHLERVLVHVEPVRKPVVRLAVPLAKEEGTLARKFGSAPFFALLEVEVEALREQGRRCLPNPYRDEEKKRGLKVSRWLLDEGVDGVITREGLEGEAPGYVFNDAGVFTCTVGVETLDALLDRLKAEGLCGYLD